MKSIGFHPDAGKYYNEPVNMNTRQKSNSFLTLLCIAITWVFLLQDGNGLYALSRWSHDPSTAQVELVVQKPPSGSFKYQSSLLSLKPSEGLFPGHLVASDPDRFRPFIESLHFTEKQAGGQPVRTPTCHLLSILKKKNRCHQSSDDDPPPLESSLS